MTSSTEELLHLRRYIRASREVTGWIAGAKALALLAGAVDSGIVEALRTRSTARHIADVTGMDKQDVVAVCVALEAHGVVQQDGEHYQLTPDYAVLSSPSAAIPLPSLIHYARVMIRTLQAGAPSDVVYTATPAEDILAIAEGSGISALSASPHVGWQSVVRLVPEVEAMWRAGARHLEVGCGVGNSLLGTVTTYPGVTAVGIEIDELTAREAERRADLLGVSERVELRRMDACDLADQNAFDTIQWSQFFFPAASRPVVLRAMRRALKPGGYLFMPLLGSVSDDVPRGRATMLRMAWRTMRSGGGSSVVYLNDALGDTARRRKRERRAAAANRLLFSRWGVPARTVGELEAELERGGFTVIRTMPTPVGQFALTRGVLLARRPPSSEIPAGSGCGSR